ncbi:fibroblast growth factor intracellular binding protein [Paraphysoderma sedebokerense]|nr:fibroblast growth factor intracellular binding protein [Paraphysoderma sedebokerense]
MSDFTVFVTDSAFIDQSIYQLWLMGHSAHDSSVNGKSSLQTRINNAAGEKKPSSQIMKSYVLSHYRQFEMMEHFLHRPRSFVNSGFLFPMSLEAKKDLIEQYYSFDEIVMREFLGKKLNSRSRKDLDDICERTRILLPCCRRQFDNLKRIQKRVEDAEGELVEIIQKDFLLTRSLASQYAHINFININRLDTSKKKLSILSFADFEYCASVFMRFWTTSSAFAMEDVDPTIASDVREVKAIFLNSKDNMEEYRQLVSNNLPSDSVTTEKSLQTQFRTLVRNVLGIGAGLSQSKELRDIFINLVEKIVEPCIALEWTAADLESFFDIMVNQFSNLGCMNAQSKQQYQPSFARLLNGIKLASIKLYSRYHKT